MNHKNIDDVFKYIESQGIIMEYGMAYNLYECGHIVSNAVDTRKMIYYADVRLRNRCCPICFPIPTRLSTKAKICFCGTRQIGIRLQTSKQCTACHNTKTAKNKKPNLKFKNGHLFDEKGSDCLFRLDCLKKYDKYACTPCLGCKKFIKQDFSVTDHLSARGNSSENFTYTRRELF